MTEGRVDRYRQLFVQIGEAPARALMDRLQVLALTQPDAMREFWYQSFQYWQSEFLAVGSIVVLTIVLRQKGSPESKPVHAPHRETGTN